MSLFCKRLILAAALLAAAGSLALPTRAADDPKPPTAAEQDEIAQAKLASLLNGPVTVYLEGNTTTPFLIDATFKMRYRLGDRDFLIFDDHGTKVILRAEQIIAIKVTPSK